MYVIKIGDNNVPALIAYASCDHVQHHHCVSLTLSDGDDVLAANDDFTSPLACVECNSCLFESVVSVDTIIPSFIPLPSTI